MATEEYSAFALNVFTRQDSSSSTSIDFDFTIEYQFVEKLEERYRCAYCRTVLHNPNQTGCGHRFCQQCITTLMNCYPAPICPIDKEVIKPNEVFKDNCCRREVLDLQVFCKYYPDCTSNVTLGRFRDHLQVCLFETVHCTNTGCYENVLRKDSKHHQKAICLFREEACQYCKIHLPVYTLKDHELTDCPNFPIQCPSGCHQTIQRSKIAEHSQVCLETEQECPYKRFGCLFKDKRINIQEHENAALREHMILVLERNTELEQQKTLSSQNDKVTWLETQMKQLTHTVNREQNRLHFKEVTETIENLRQKIVGFESYGQQVASLHHQLKKHEDAVNSHNLQLGQNQDRFKLIENVSYNGKLIWKITEYKRRKQEAIEGRTVSVFSQPFYTSRCGYKLCARAYLNGDGTGKGSHLSLFFVVMRGDYDSLLQWPFKQKVTLMLLDQSGKRNHFTEIFKADPNSASFKRPVTEWNIASGCPKFISHTQLETEKNALYINDDTLFIKIVVDISDLEEL
ncbi:TNF receptor-associated factor 5 isoform X2 [Protopterus annectens]|uniref:TNF receptor-associated factor 5 isoform X2 n=1 Tax=Protopterus annectens TaxID=7888 RepID=UPI001CFA1031|nr:TNF receptor-associated factor 5 isoform X2 [Protopterus annectens]